MVQDDFVLLYFHLFPCFFPIGQSLVRPRQGSGQGTKLTGGGQLGSISFHVLMISCHITGNYGRVVGIWSSLIWFDLSNRQLEVFDAVVRNQKAVLFCFQPGCNVCTTSTFSSKGWEEVPLSSVFPNISHSWNSGCCTCIYSKTQVTWVCSKHNQA